MCSEYAEFFAQNGFVIARNVLDRAAVDEVGDYLKGKLEATSAIFARRGLNPAEPQFSTKIGEIVREVARSGSKDEMDAFSGTFPLEVRLSQALWRIANQSQLQRLLVKILASDRLFMHMVPSPRFVYPGYTHAAVPPHRDVMYNDHLTDFVTVWTPFVKIDEHCGGVRVFLNSHRSGADHDQAQADDAPLWKGQQATNGFNALDCYLDPGDVLIMHKHMLHSSRPNNSNDVRLSMDMRFFGAEARTTKHYLDLQQMEVFAPFSGGQHARI